MPEFVVQAEFRVTAESEAAAEQAIDVLCVEAMNMFLADGEFKYLGSEASAA